MAKKLKEVIVIGGGVAGLAAAKALTAKNVRVTLLEARNRLGGRILTQRETDLHVPIELGAEFIHGRPRHLWDLADQARLAIIDLPNNHLLYHNGKLRVYDEFWPQLEQINKRMHKEREDMTMKEFLKRNFKGKRWRQGVKMAKSFVKGFHAARVDKIGIDSLKKSDEASAEIDGERQFRIIDGYDRVIEALRAGLKVGSGTIHLNTVATEINWQKGQAEVRGLVNGAPTVFSAGAVLLTLPLGVLKAKAGSKGAVAFNPGLPPEKEKAVQSLETGAVMKMVLQFKTRFWEDRHFAGKTSADLRDLHFIHAPEETVPTAWSSLPVRVPILTAWAGGPIADKLLPLSEREIQRCVLNSLSAVFGVKPARLERVLDRTYFHHWNNDPFARGAYSYIPSGAGDAPAELGRPLSDTLFFAGEATDTTGNTGTVHAALDSGLRAANEILAAS